MMSNLTISPTLNKNKVFILNRSELVDRWDPLLVLYKRENQSFKYETKRLKNLLVSNPEYGAGEIGIQRKTETEPRYIRITDIDEFGLLSSDMGVTAKTIDQKYFLEDNDFLFARSGATVGKAYLHKKDLVPYPCFYAGYMIRYRLNEKEILPEYLFAITQTRFYKNWVKAIQRPAGQPNINAEEYKSLTFPLPPFEIQKKVVKIFSLAYEQKKQNEAAAEELLASIDDYLLKELGVVLPEQTENNLRIRIFTTSFTKITGQRYDPTYHRLNYEKFSNSLKNSYFKICKLKDIILFLDYGLMPTQDYAFIEDEGLPMIRVTNIMKDGYINMDKVEYIKFNTPKLKDKIVQENDILMVQCGNTTGKCAMVTKEFVGYTYGSFSFAIRANPKIANQHFLFYLLASKIIQEQLNRSITITSVRPNTSKPEVENFLIPVPPLAKQKEIAEHITDIRRQAQQLKDKTKEAMKKASEEIEKILLH